MIKTIVVVISFFYGVMVYAQVPTCRIEVEGSHIVEGYMGSKIVARGYYHVTSYNVASAVQALMASGACVPPSLTPPCQIKVEGRSINLYYGSKIFYSVESYETLAAYSVAKVQELLWAAHMCQ